MEVVVGVFCGVGGMGAPSFSETCHLRLSVPTPHESIFIKTEDAFRRTIPCNIPVNNGNPTIKCVVHRLRSLVKKQRFGQKVPPRS